MEIPYLWKPPYDPYVFYNQIHMWTQEIPWIGRRILMDLWAYKRSTAPVLISFKNPWTIVKSCIKSCCIYHFYHQHPSTNVCYIHHKPSVWWLTYPSEKWWSSSVGMIFPFPIWWESHNGAMFQSPPSSGIHPSAFRKKPMELSLVSRKGPDQCSSSTWSKGPSSRSQGISWGPWGHGRYRQKKFLVDRLVTHQPKTNS